jgi:phage-related minor tail protein
MPGVVSELRARFSAQISSFKSAVAGLKQEINNIGRDSAKATSEANQAFEGMRKSLTNLRSALKNAGAGSSDMFSGLDKAITKAESDLSTFGRLSVSTMLELQMAVNKAQKTLDKLGDNVDLGGLDQAIREADKAIQDFGKDASGATKEAEQALQSYQATFSKLRMIGATAFVGLSAGIAGAITVTDDYQRALNGVAAQTGATGEETKQLGETLKNIYAANYGESFADIGEALSITANNTGLAGKALEEMTKQALLLRDTFQYDVTETTRTADTLMKQFGITGEQAFTLIAQGAQKGLDKSGDMLDTFNEYAVYFKQLGFDAEGMFNVLAAGAEAGAFNLDKVGDAIKELGIRVKDQSKTTHEAFAALGLDATQMEQAFAKGGSSAQKALQTVFQKLGEIEDPVKRNAIGVALMGTQFEDLEYKTILALGKVRDEANMSADTLKKMDQVRFNSLGEAMRGVGRMLQVEVIDSVQQKVMPTINNMINSLRQNLPAIKEVFGAALNAIFDTINKFKPTFENLFIIFKNAGGWVGSVLVVAFTALGSVLAPIINGITTIVAKFTEWEGFIPIMNGILAGFLAYKAYLLALQAPMLLQIARTKALAVATRLLNLVMSLNPIGLIIALLVGLGVALYTAWQKSETFRNIVLTAWNAIKSGAIAVFEWLKKVVPQTIQAISNAWSSFKSWCSELWTSLKNLAISIFTGLVTGALNLWRSLKTGISNFITGIKNFAVNTFNALRSALQNIVTGTKNIILTIFSGIKTGISNIIYNVKNIITQTFSAIRSYVSGWISAVRSIFNTGFQAIKAIIQAVLQIIKAIFTGNFGAIKGIVSNLLSNLRSIFSSGLNNVMSIVRNTASRIISAFKGINLVSVGANIVRGLWNGISNMAGWIKDKVTSFAKSIKEKVTSFFGIHSPSRVFRDIGNYLGEGLAIGIDQSRKLVAKTTQALAESAMIEPDPAGIGAMTGEVIASQLPKPDNSGDSSEGAGIVTNYQAPLMYIENYYQNDETDARVISNGLFRLQQDYDRARGRKTV